MMPSAQAPRSGNLLRELPTYPGQSPSLVTPHAAAGPGTTVNSSGRSYGQSLILRLVRAPVIGHPVWGVVGTHARHADGRVTRRSRASLCPDLWAGVPSA